MIGPLITTLLSMLPESAVTFTLVSGLVLGLGGAVLWGALERMGLGKSKNAVLTCIAVLLIAGVLGWSGYQKFAVAAPTEPTATAAPAAQPTVPRAPPPAAPPTTGGVTVGRDVNGNICTSGATCIFPPATPKPVPAKPSPATPTPQSPPLNIDGNDNDVHNNRGFADAPRVRGNGNQYYDNFGTGETQQGGSASPTIQGNRNSVSRGTSDTQRPLIQGNDNTLSHYSIIGGDPGKPLFMGSGAHIDGFMYAMVPKFFPPAEINRQFGIMIPLINEFFKDRTDQLNPDLDAEAAYLNQKLGGLNETFRVRVVADGKALQTISYRP